MKIMKKAMTVLALCALAATGTATWLSGAAASAAPAATASAKTDPEPAADTTPAKEKKKASKTKQALSGKVNLNTATSEQLQMLPGVGPSKADRIVAWRQKNGNFKRVADLRKVKGFGYKTLKKLEPFLDVKGDTTLAAK